MNNSNAIFLLVVLAILLVFNIYQFSETQKLKKQISTQNEEIYSLKGDLEDATKRLKVAVTFAYSLSSAIQDAKNYTWGTYEDMGYALESLPE